MINNKLSELFNKIENSCEYKSYLEIGSLLESDKEINDLLEEIKTLQKKSVNLEYNNNPLYKEIDKEIEEKVKLLNSKPIYKEYLNKMGEFNSILNISNKNKEDYIDNKI